MYTEIFQKLQEIFACQAFELHGPSPSGECYIPYIMNDQVESYLVLENCRMTGERLPGYEEETKGRILETERGYALVVEQGEENTFTLWFERIRQVTEFYRYHEIGHFWVEGQEQWRQLVYIIGTTYDKLEYLGEEACNEKELALIPLMEFAPFRYWSPIHEDINGRYPDSQEGLERMAELAREAGDVSYARVIGLYGWLRVPGLEGVLTRILAKRLLSPRREDLYGLLWQKVVEASRNYPARDYGPVMNEKIRTERRRVTEILHQKGYTGTYPDFQRADRFVAVTEEHPFTILEAEDYPFRIQFLVSESTGRKLGRNSGKSGKNSSQPGRKSGFFKGKGRRGWIENDIKNL